MAEFTLWYREYRVKNDLRLRRSGETDWIPLEFVYLRGSQMRAFRRIQRLFRQSRIRVRKIILKRLRPHSLKLKAKKKRRL
jgi:hypothetical protein